jgi:hypothetical protein
MASIIATGNRKMLVDLRSSGVNDNVRGGLPFQMPRQPNTDKPLFSIGEGNFLGVFSSNESTDLFVQYFDE